MYLKFQNSHDRTYIYLARKEKTEKGTYKETILKSLGSFPLSFTPDQIKEAEDLMRLLLEDSQELSKKENSNQKMDKGELIELINNQPDLADAMPVNLTPFIVDKILTRTGYREFFEELQKTGKCGYSLYNVFRFIVIYNTVDPGSLLKYFKTQNRYLFPEPDQEIKEQDLYRL